MKNIPTLPAAVSVWLVMAIALACAIIALNMSGARLLRIAAAPSESERIPQSLITFLDIREPYARLISRFQSDNPAGQPRPALARDADYLSILRVRDDIRNAGKARDDLDVPIEFILSDSCWMVGESASSLDFLSLPFQKAELQPPPR